MYTIWANTFFDPDTAIALAFIKTALMLPQSKSPQFQTSNTLNSHCGNFKNIYTVNRTE